MSEIYDRHKDQISEISTPVFNYIYNPTDVESFRGPRIVVRPNWRILDGGLHTLIINDGGKLKRVSYFAPVKHDDEKSGDDIVIDAITGALIDSRENLDSGSFKDSEIYIFLLSLRSQKYSSMIEALGNWVDIWFKTDIFGLINTKGYIKGPKREMIETTVIDAINLEIRTSPDLSKQQLVEKLKNDFRARKFIQEEIVDKHIFISDSDISRIQDFLFNLANDIDTCYTDIIIVKNGKIDIIKGLSRGLQKRDYFITNSYISASKLKDLGIEKIFDLYGHEVPMSGNLDKQYKFITHKTSHKLALIETNGREIKVPNEYIDGLVIQGQIFRNALLTYSDGRLLYSEFFDPYLIIFKLQKDGWTKNFFNPFTYLENDVVVGVDIYTVFSYYEGIEHKDLGNLVHLSDPTFRDKEDPLYYKITELESHFSAQVPQVRVKREGEVTCDPFADLNGILLYGEFTKEIFMHVFNQLFSDNVGKAMMFATKYLSYLNGISLGSDFTIFLEGQDINDVNDALKDLEFTEEELQKFIWKKYDPSDTIDPWKFRFFDSEGKFTVKRWLKLIYDKVTSYSANDGSVYALQRDKLQIFAQRSDEYSVIDEASIDRDIEKFTVKEARLGVEIFKSAIDIFGHFSLRLMMMNMISYYGKEGNFGLTINSRRATRPQDTKTPIENRYWDTMLDILHHVGLISPTFKHDNPLTSSLGRLRSEQDTSFFGLSILNAHLYLKLEGTKDIVKKGYNTLEFPIGPLIGLENEGRFSGNNLNDLGYILGSHFGKISSKYLNTFDTYIDFFEKHQSNVIDYIIEKKISPSLILKKGEANKKYFFMEELIYELRKDLLDIKRLHGLREKLEIFAKDFSSDSILITLGTINPSTGKPTSFEITKDDLENMGFIEFGWRSQTKMLDYINVKKSLAVDKVFNYLDDVIRLVGNERVILVPLFNTGDPKTGYQVLKRILPGEEGYYKEAPFSFLPKDGYIKLEQNDPNYKELLKYCIRLTQGGGCAFVIKKWQDNIGDLKEYLRDEQNFIIAFNRERVLNPEDIFSSDAGISYIPGYESFNIKLGDYSTSFRPTQRNWNENWICNLHLTVPELMTYLSELLDVETLNKLFLK